MIPIKAGGDELPTSTTLSERGSILTKKSEELRKKITDFITSYSKATEEFNNLVRELRLTDIGLANLKKMKLPKALKERVGACRKANADTQASAKPLMEEYFLGDDERIKFLANHPEKELGIRKKIQEISPKDIWKWKVILRSRPEDAKQSIALLKKDMLHALIPYETQAILKVKNSVQKLWNMFPNYMSQLKVVDPKFSLLSAMIDQHLEAKTAVIEDKLRRSMNRAEIPISIEKNVQTPRPEEKSPIEDLPDDVEELALTNTTKLNTLRNLAESFKDRFQQALEIAPANKKLVKFNYNRDLISIVNQLDALSEYLHISLEVQSRKNKSADLDAKSEQMKNLNNHIKEFISTINKLPNDALKNEGFSHVIDRNIVGQIIKCL